MPTMTGLSNLKTLYFPNVGFGGVLTTIQKDSLVYLNVREGNATKKGYVYWDSGFGSNFLYGCLIGQPFPTASSASGNHIGSFIPANTPIKYYIPTGGVHNIYMYIIELDNDEPNG